MNYSIPKSLLMITMIILSILQASVFCEDTKPEIKISDCKWAESKYDTEKYIRVIRKAGSSYPINYLCWERSKVSGTIFYNLANCVLAVSDEGGIDCNLCKIGFHVQGGACIKKEEKKTDDKI